jgi:hypothetical protein
VFFFDLLYFVFAVPALLLAFCAQHKYKPLMHGTWRCPTVPALRGSRSRANDCLRAVSAPVI